MSFAESMALGDFPVTLEITPPRTVKPTLLAQRARLLRNCTLAVNVIQRPDRQSSLDASLALKRNGIEPIWHLTTADRDQSEISADIERARTGDISHVLCLRGDQTTKGTPSVKVHEAIRMVYEGIPGALVAAGLDQYHETAASRRSLAAKLRAGARCVWTQPVFDLHGLTQAAEVVKGLQADTHVVAMAMPLLTVKALERVSSRLCVPVPEVLRQQVAAGKEPAWEAFNEMIVALVDEPLVDGLAIMTFEADPPPGTAERITEGLNRAGIANTDIAGSAD